jgi:hypothetical protein
MPKASELPQPFFETHGFTDREDGLIMATIRRISHETEEELHTKAKVAECRLLVRNKHTYLVRNGVEYFLHPSRIVFEDKDFVQTTATPDVLKKPAVIKRMHKAIPVIAQIRPDPLLESVTDEQIDLLDQALVRYRVLAKTLASETTSLDPGVVAQDRAQFGHLIKPGENGLPAFRETDCVSFTARVTGLPRDLCKYWLRYDFFRENGVEVEELASM